MSSVISTPSTNGETERKSFYSQTLREELDRKIELARKHVEELCITKAKLEALNVLDHPSELYYKAVF